MSDNDERVEPAGAKPPSLEARVATLERRLRVIFVVAGILVPSGSITAYGLVTQWIAVKKELDDAEGTVRDRMNEAAQEGAKGAKAELDQLHADIARARKKLDQGPAPVPVRIRNTKFARCMELAAANHQNMLLQPCANTDSQRWVMESGRAESASLVE